MNRRGFLGALIGLGAAAVVPIKFVAEQTKRVAKWVSVRWFGAKGDGITDDTEAFRKAIAAAGEGGTVFVPPGVYKIDA